MKPTDRIGLMNPDFRYVKSAETDLRKTFARVRRELAQKSAQPVVVKMQARGKRA